MNVLITGGAGFIGSHIAKRIRALGHHPIAYDNLSTGHKSAVKWGPLIEGDLSDRPLLNEVFVDARVDMVIHCAGSAYVEESMRKPEMYFVNNVSNTLNLLEAMRASHLRVIVFSSSCATYGIPSVLPINEDAPQRPESPYGESKLMIESILRWYGRCYGFRWIALRYFNAAGADLDGEIGELHEPETHLVARAILTALGKVECLQIFGDNYNTIDGTPIRDYVHVVDLAEAHIASIDYLLGGGESLAINLGTGNGHSVLEVIRCIESISGRCVRKQAGVGRDGDPAILFADSRRARELLGWVPNHSDLETIVGSAMRWHESHS